MEEKLSCDGGHEFKLLFSCPSGLSPSQVTLPYLCLFFSSFCMLIFYDLNLFIWYKVSVVFDEAYDRNPHPDHTLEKSISEVVLRFSYFYHIFSCFCIHLTCIFTIVNFYQVSYLRFIS